MTFNASLDVNSDWYTGSDGYLYTDVLENMQLKSDDSVSIKLVLTKHMTEENTGLVNNIAEIYEDYNTYGVPDINSTPANRIEKENDMGRADVIISINTGNVVLYISVIMFAIVAI